jgi:hypothetical protein
MAEVQMQCMGMLQSSSTWHGAGWETRVDVQACSVRRACCSPDTQRTWQDSKQRCARTDGGAWKGTRRRQGRAASGKEQAREPGSTVLSGGVGKTPGTRLLDMQGANQGAGEETQQEGAT